MTNSVAETKNARAVDLVGLLVDMLRGSLAKSQDQKREARAEERAARADNRAGRAAYISTVQRINDRLGFAVPMIDDTKRRLLQMPLAEAAEHGEELLDRWADLNKATTAGLQLLESSQVPPEWSRVDSQLRRALMTIGAGAEILLGARSPADTARANRMLADGWALYGSATRAMH